MVTKEMRNSKLCWLVRLTRKSRSWKVSMGLCRLFLESRIQLQLLPHLLSQLWASRRCQAWACRTCHLRQGWQHLEPRLCRLGQLSSPLALQAHLLRCPHLRGLQVHCQTSLQELQVR